MTDSGVTDMSALDRMDCRVRHYGATLYLRCDACATTKITHFAANRSKSDAKFHYTHFA